MAERILNDMNVECPYCKHEQGDSWEYFCDSDNETEIVCGECERTFLAYPERYTTYVSYVKD